MKKFKTLLIISVALLSLISLPGCKTPYSQTSPSNPPATGSNQESVKPTQNSSDQGSIKPTTTENSEQASLATAPSFSLPDINTGKTVEFPGDVIGSKTALVFFSLT